jgi:hypothetical protein
MNVDLSVYDIGDLGLDDDEDYNDDYMYSDAYDDHYCDDDYDSDTESATSYNTSVFTYDELSVCEDDIPVQEEEKFVFKSSLPCEVTGNVYHFTDETLAHARSLLTGPHSSVDIFNNYMNSLIVTDDSQICETENNADLECSVSNSPPRTHDVHRTKSGRLTKQERRAAFKELRMAKRSLNGIKMDEKVPYLLEDERVKGQPGEFGRLCVDEKGVT